MKANDRDLLIFKALCALAEVADATRAAPVTPTLATRFAVAFLFANSNGDRWVFDEFLEHIARQPIPGQHQQEYIRFTRANSCVTGIMGRIVRWDCPGIPHQMITQVQRGQSANAVWREALAARADLERRRQQDEVRTPRANA